MRSTALGVTRVTQDLLLLDELDLFLQQLAADLLLCGGGVEWNWRKKIKMGGKAPVQGR